MRARCVSFFADPAELGDVRQRIAEYVLPRFSTLPGFAGILVLQSEASRPEVLALSFWEHGLEASEPASEELRDEIERLTGATPSRKEYVVASLVMDDQPDAGG